jgi:hypothetical protein
MTYQRCLLPPSILTFTRLHGAVFQTAVAFMLAAVRTSDITEKY